jgi:hypothetical protein
MGQYFNRCCSREECDGCQDDYNEFQWVTFCNTWYWIAMNNALVELNKCLILDLGKSEELLDQAGKKFRGKIKYL